MMKTKQNYLNSGHFEQALDRLTQDYVYYLYREQIFFKRNISKGTSSLDVGCGEGRSTKILADIAGLEGKVIGIDNNLRVVNIAREKCSIYRNIHITRDNALNLGKYAERFEYIIFAFNMLGLFNNKNRHKVLSGAKKILRPKGKILATVFSEKAAPYQAMQYSNCGAKNVKISPKFVHINDFGYKARRFTKEEIEQIFSKSGLKSKIEELTPMAYDIIGTK